MNNRSKTTPTALLALTLCLFAGAVSAQSERSGNADARVMQQLQQFAGERAALQAEVAKLKQELEQAKKQEQKVSAEKTAVENRNRALQATAGRESDKAGKQAEEQLERSRAQLQELVGKFRETAQTLRDVEGERATMKEQLMARERQFKACVDRNAGLYNLNGEVLDRMEHRGLWSGLAEKEPFTQVKRVQLENLIDEYKYRADELRLEQQRASGAK